jgi:hypothetical protein
MPQAVVPAGQAQLPDWQVCSPGQSVLSQQALAGMHPPLHDFCPGAQALRLRPVRSGASQKFEQQSPDFRQMASFGRQVTARERPMPSSERPPPITSAPIRLSAVRRLVDPAMSRVNSSNDESSKDASRSARIWMVIVRSHTRRASSSCLRFSSRSDDIARRAGSPELCPQGRTACFRVFGSREHE